jgi:hypothetical protein
VSLRGYVNKEDEEKEKEEEVCASCQQSGGPNVSSELFIVMCDSKRSKISDLLSAHVVSQLTKWGDKVMEH